VKDLYKQLGVDPFLSSVDDIQRAVSSASDDDLARDAAHILLNDERRQIYDRTHQTLLKIGQLRARMGIRSNIIGASSDLADFYFPSIPGETELAKLEKTKARALLRSNVLAIAIVLTVLVASFASIALFASS